MKKILLLFFILPILVYSETIFVKYRGNINVDSKYFQHLNIQDSSLVKNMYYDKNHRYLLVQLKQTYYHYCEVPPFIINEWLNSSSLGTYFRQKVKGGIYDCRLHSVPQY
ncbi:MAG: KTSC domain-containing protein [Sulfurovaceae bacterium]